MTGAAGPGEPEGGAGAAAGARAEEPQRRRRHRRAIGGVPASPAPPAVEGPVLPRSPDDEDTGWGEPPSGNDERLLRDVPPHW